MLPDNNTADSTYHNGTSSRPELFELFIILRKLDLYHVLKLHLIHVTDTIIEQGTDGLSRVNKLEGVPSGVKILNFVPIYDSALCQKPLLIDWICNWKSYP